MNNLLFNIAEAQTANRTTTGLDTFNQVVPVSTFGGGSGSALSNVLNQVFYLGLAIAVIAAVVMIIRGGVQYMTIDAAASKKSGARMVQAAIGGLVLAFAAVLILNTINPNITSLSLDFKPLQQTGGFGTTTVTSGTRTDTGTSTNPSGSTGGSNVALTNEELKAKLSQKIQEYGLTNLSPADKAAFFPNGGTEQEWMALVSAMMKYESGFKAGTTYQESFTDSKGNYVISTGLLQLSQESVRGYSAYNPALANITTEDLMNPDVNMDAGLTILKRLVERDGCISCIKGYTSSGNPIYGGGAAYWSVLRPTGKLDEVKATMAGN